jgi:hypothetical protein
MHLSKHTITENEVRNILLPFLQNTASLTVMKNHVSASSSAEADKTPMRIAHLEKLKDLLQMKSIFQCKTVIDVKIQEIYNDPNEEVCVKKIFPHMYILCG